MRPSDKSSPFFLSSDSDSACLLLYRFYHEREQEMHRRVDNLKLQCKELAEHRRIYHVCRPHLPPCRLTRL